MECVAKTSPPMSPNEHVFVCFYHQTYCFGNFWTLPRASSRYARVTTLTAPWRWTWTRGRTATPRTPATSSPRCTAACTSGRTRTTPGVVSTIIYISTYLQILSPRPPLQRPLPRPDAVSEELHGEARPQEEQLPRLERPQGSLRPEVSFVEVIEVSHFNSHFSCERILIIVVYLQIKQKVWKLSKEVHRNKVSMWFHQLCHYPHYSPFSLPSNPHT